MHEPSKLALGGTIPLLCAGPCEGKQWHISPAEVTQQMGTATNALSRISWEDFNYKLKSIFCPLAFYGAEGIWEFSQTGFLEEKLLNRKPRASRQAPSIWSRYLMACCFQLPHILWACSLALTLALLWEVFCCCHHKQRGLSPM